MPRLGAAEELRSPHLMLSHIGNADRILIDERAHTADQLLRTNLR